MTLALVNTSFTN